MLFRSDDRESHYPQVLSQIGEPAQFVYKVKDESRQSRFFSAYGVVYSCAEDLRVQHVAERVKQGSDDASGEQMLTALKETQKQLSMLPARYFLFSFILYAHGGLFCFKTFQKTSVKMLWVFQQEMF